MSKAEKFIQEHTKTCSNVISGYQVIDNGVPQAIYKEWLTPDQARRAVEIAREEMMERACDAYCKVCKLNCNHKECHYINNFKQAMKDE